MLETRRVPALCLVFLIGCASSQVSRSTTSYTGPSPTSIALSPGGGVLGEAIGLELFNRGYAVVDPGEAAALIGRESLTEFELTRTASLKSLHGNGIEAVLIVKSVAGDDGRPQSATARITSTANGEIISAVSWQNGWGGMAGSPADRTMRKDVAEAAQEIVAALMNSLAPPK